MASYIKERTKNAQFIVISLRNNMFELAARLVGVYKVNHMVSFKSHPDPSTALAGTDSVVDQECDCREQRLHHWEDRSMIVRPCNFLWERLVQHWCTGRFGETGKDT